MPPSRGCRSRGLRDSRCAATAGSRRGNAGSRASADTAAEPQGSPADDTKAADTPEQPKQSRFAPSHDSSFGEFFPAQRAANSCPAASASAKRTPGSTSRSNPHAPTPKPRLHSLSSPPPSTSSTSNPTARRRQEKPPEPTAPAAPATPLRLRRHTRGHRRARNRSRRLRIPPLGRLQLPRLARRRIRNHAPIKSFGLRQGRRRRGHNPRSTRGAEKYFPPHQRAPRQRPSARVHPRPRGIRSTSRPLFPRREIQPHRRPLVARSPRAWSTCSPP